MARVKRSVNGKKHRRAILEEAQGYTGAAQPALPQGQRAGHALAPLRLPRPAGAQGRVPQALDRPDQRGVPRARHVVLALHGGFEGCGGRGRPQDACRPRRARAGRRSRRSSRPHAVPSTPPELFATKAEIKRLRALLRERRTRDDEGVFVCEGPRVIAAALEHGVELARVLRRCRRDRRDARSCRTGRRDRRRLPRSRHVRGRPHRRHGQPSAGVRARGDASARPRRPRRRRPCARAPRSSPIPGTRAR